MRITLAELNAQIAKFLADKLTGQITLNVNEGRIESFDFRRHGRVVDNDAVERYADALVPMKRSM